jgi:phosphoribosylformylglycinamidine cyclo-ligase
LLAPTRIYVQPVLRLLEALPDVVDALVHITGGGFYDNLPRVLPASLAVRLDATAWTPPPVFGWLQQLGALSDETMYHTFNQGIGMVLLCAARHAQDVIHFLAQQDATLAPRILGEVIPRDAAEMPGVVMTGLVDAS